MIEYNSTISEMIAERTDAYDNPNHYVLPVNDLHSA